MAEWPKTVQARNRPDVDLVVDEAEYNDLFRQGLLVDDKPAKAQARTNSPKEG